MKYFDFSSIYTDEKEKQYSNVCWNIPNFSKYEKDFKTYTVSARTEFRPDKIAYSLYEDERLSWVINEINNISNLSDYTMNKKIYYLPYNILSILGVV